MKFQSKHSVRDSQLPIAREHLLNSIIRNLQSKSDVIGIFLGGSIAKNNTDLFSDIDLRVVVAEEKFQEYIRNKKELAKEFGDVLFFEDMYLQAPYTIAHYSSFIKVDLFIYTFSRLQPSTWLQGIRIIKDTDVGLRSILEQSEAIQYTVSSDDVEKWRGKVFAYIHEIYRRVFREEFYYALGQMNNLRAYIVTGWNMEVDRLSNEAWDWSKIEGARSSLERWQLSLLATWDCGRDQQEMMKALYSMVPEIRRLHTVLCQKTGLEMNEEHFERIVNQVL